MIRKRFVFNGRVQGVGFRYLTRRAADLIDQMEAQGVISPAGHSGKREILVPDNR